ncbi:metallophosphoesterase family protein [Candidatus Sumerlaeota bacterium]|nr:metallophosphoesterase family protein [Candidatus Sumerlaeota bacterium]
MSNRQRFTRLFVIELVAILSAAGSVAADPRHVYLTWQGDTAHSITVNYQTLPKDGKDVPESDVFYDTEARAPGFPQLYRYNASGRSHKITGLPDGRMIHWVELTSLIPGRTYYFIAGDPLNWYTAPRKFRTIPDDADKLRFVIGGDIGTGGDPELLFQQAAAQSPDFAVVGGDIAYANDDFKEVGHWDEWLDNWERRMTTPEGLTIPMMLAIGNHEVLGGSSRNFSNVKFYFGFFAQEFGHSYFSRRFGKNVAILALDTGHFAPHAGSQAEWLDQSLASLTSVSHRFCVYHVPLYPSHRAHDDDGSVTGRRVWAPIFEKYQITAAFENHDHTFKRTKRIRAGAEDPEHGILYLGDGCWGRPARTVDNQIRWYLDKQASLQHFWRVDVMGDRVEYRAITKSGKIFDVYPSDSPGAEEAEKMYNLLTRPELVF